MPRTKKEVREKASVDFDFTESLDDAEYLTKSPCLEVKSRLDASIALHSGSLMFDTVILGGGYYPGRAYDNVGQEQSGKTTFGNMAIANALISIPNYNKGAYFDVEGALDPSWLINIIKTQVGDADLGYDYTDPDNIFGKRNQKGNGWEIRPRIRLYKPLSGDAMLLSIVRYLSALPDKVLMKDTWYYQWAAVSASKAKKTGGLTDTQLRALFKRMGIETDASVHKESNVFACPVPNNYGGPEGIIFVDSWAAATPEQTTDDDSSSMAQQGRMYGKHINNVKTLVAKKGVILLGVNQNRLNPGARFGNPEYNPGGEALKHICDCRNRMQGISNQNGSGEFEEEGKDKYRHFSVINKKNKITIPGNKFKGRWWVQRNGKGGCGLDIVQDTLDYLKVTGQLTSVRKGFTFNIYGDSSFAKWINGRTISYKDFKKMVLKREFDGKKVDLRSRCLKQIKSGVGIELYHAQSNNEKEEQTEE